MSKRYGSASSLIEELGITEPDEIDVNAIAQYCGATIAYHPLRGCEARILGHNDRAIITINSAGPRTRQRFSAGHELGHWMRDRGNTAFACTDEMLHGEWQGRSREADANQFAAELLMPDKIFSRYTRDKQVIFETVEELSRSFETSLTATAIRLVQAGPLPSMVIYMENGLRRWFVRGPDVPESIWPRDVPTRYTVAADLLAGKTPRTPNEIRGDGWLDRRGARDYCVVEDSRVVGANKVLTLIWWKDERPLVDITAEDEEADYR